MTTRFAKTTLSTAVLAGALAFGGAATAQTYPDRPVGMIVTFGPGGGSDVMGRTMARLMEESLGVSIPVSNVGGASGNAGLTQLRTNPADGYTIGTLISLTVASWASGLGDNKPEDFEVISVIQSSPSFLFVPANSPHQTAEALFEFAKANPGAITVATSGYGTQDDVTLKLLADAGVTMENVPFQAPAERYASPIGGHTSAIYEEPGDVGQFIKGGQLIPVVVFSDKRHPEFPDVPTSAELGIDISGLDNYRSLAVSAGTPPEIVAKLAEAVATATASDDWKEFCSSTYTCITPVTGDAAQAMVRDFRALIAEQLAN
ncbi:tripartite tricarboxylate transporter substrate binding protein [Oceaniovalibus sp. ACAM 378]|uniref:tripartite tricarboxylate transporter substrate binding protein n=1 Tax=Oceaniovalibus sp. ACAM 378 TaxID=2599923 RepID=UPI0011D55B52|nr:tripartite tricarboxylate transporter substrate binding protein [Oceaniovalibus sp. ACAM 378]TYB83611.1 tripartite tricarboxylate transporter substrate binding protein [Oceaniovalibus sp. ACAM 378]